jgi:predicted RNA-binding protein YlqC (UPF0109 family)
MEKIKDLILLIAKALVDDQEKVSVQVIEGPRTYVLELSVSKNDVGKIIGKQGRTAEALRTILNAAAAKTGKRCNLEILE